MQKISLFLFVCLLSSVIYAQNSPEKYGSVITGQDLKKHLTIIASADMEGRETATEGQRKAAAYIESQFKMLDLQPPPNQKGYQQIYPLNKDTLLSSLLKIGKNKYEFGKDFLVNPLGTNNQEIKAKEIVFVGYGIDDKSYDDYGNKDVKGKIVAYFGGEPKADGKYLVSGTNRTSRWSISNNKAILAKQKGAIGAILIMNADSIAQMMADNARHTNVYYPRPVSAENERVIYASVVNNVAKQIFTDASFNEVMLKAKNNEALNTYNFTAAEKVKFEYKKKTLPYFSSNVIGVMEGTDKKDEYVFLTGHYDHLGKRGDVIWYGADDDGSGTVGVLEMATAFAKAKAEGHGPRRTIVFMTVSGEEKGLWGSEYYSDHPLFPLDKTSVDLNTDMVGRLDTERKTGDSLNYVYVIGHDKLSSDLPIINEAVNNKYTNLKLDYKYDDPNDKQRIYFRSDHYNFARKGVPILFFYDGMLLADYHKPTDTVDKINWDLYEKRVRMIFYTAWEMANRNDMLKRDIPLAAQQ